MNTCWPVKRTLTWDDLHGEDDNVDSPTSQTTLYFRGIPRATKEQFKAACARRGVPMTRAIEAYMLQVIRNDQLLLIPSEVRK